MSWAIVSLGEEYNFVHGLIRMGSCVSQTGMQTQVQQNGPYHCSRSSLLFTVLTLFMVLTDVHGPYHCSWSYHCSRSLLWTHLTFHNGQACTFIEESLLKADLSTGDMERWRAWEPGVDEGTSRRKGTAVRVRGAPQVSLQVCPGFSLTVCPLVCPPLCLLLPDDFALWDFGPWRP